MAPKQTGDHPAERGPPPGAGRYAYQGLDRIMHEKARLGILASLAANRRGLLFTDLKRLCSLTDGNLSRHLTALGEAGLVEDSKDAAGPRTQTTYRLTAEGQHRFAEYLGVLEKVVADAQASARREASARPRRSGLSPT